MRSALLGLGADEHLWSVFEMDIYLLNYLKVLFIMMAS